MQAFLLDRYAKDGSLRLGDMPQPVPGDDEVLVEIHAGFELKASAHRDWVYRRAVLAVVDVEKHRVLIVDRYKN